MSSKTKLRWQLIGLAILSIAALLLAWPREDVFLKAAGIDTSLSIRRGLDLRGGVYLVYEAEIADGASEDTLEQATAVIERRVNPSGASEAIVQTAADDRIIVQLPDVDDPQAAIELIGQTAQLQFLEVDTSAENPAEQLRPTEVSGDDIAEATAVFDQFNRPIVNLEFKNGESTDQFAALTTRIVENGTQLLTLLDGVPVFGPAQVQQPILTGESQLSGDFDLEGAQEVATLLNAGALPVPVELVASSTIGPTLGADSLQASLLAAVIGILALGIFLIANYRLGGLVAVASMLIYMALTLSVFKLSTLPIFAGYTIVLTLAGVAGFILGITVAADANILVLERLREEKRRGLSAIAAVESAYRHAWSSIRDASVSTLIICVVLYALASRFGEASIQGFALVLALGVVLNLINISVVTRTLLRGLVRSRLGGKL